MADTFRIIRQTEVTDFSGTEPVASWQVTFETVPNAIQGTVTIPKTRYTPEHVRQVVEAEAENLEAIHQL